MLGSKNLNNLVLALSTKSLYDKFGTTEQMMWDHSVGTAISAKLISSGLGPDIESVAFIGGLMHDIGKVVMNNEATTAYVGVMMNDRIDSIMAEEKVFGYNHTEIGSKVIEKWGFPPVLINIVAHHHLHTCTLEGISDPITAKAIACVHLANGMSKILGIGYSSPNRNIVVHEFPSAIFLNMTEESLGDLVKDISEAYEKERSVFQ
jgi:putative nucleotidyltransferase with HDIG domain